MVITHPDQLSATWIEAVLRRSGALQGGHVDCIEVLPETLEILACSVRIRVRYADGAAGECPPHLLLKTSGGESRQFGAATLRFFSDDYAGLADAPLPGCYDAVTEALPRRYHLLLRDAADTHRRCDQDEPDRAHGEALARALASLHAHLWGQRCERAARPTRTEVRHAIDLYAAHARSGLQALLDTGAPEIDERRAGELHRLFARLAERFAQRAGDGIDLTTLHGDPAPAHLLAPLDGHGPLLLAERVAADWMLTRWLGASDLANAIVPWWETSVRRELERPVLHAYHTALRARGVLDYSLQQLYDDYRLCVVQAIALAAEGCRLEDDRVRLRWLWRRQLRRALAAYDDLECAALWA